MERLKQMKCEFKDCKRKASFLMKSWSKTKYSCDYHKNIFEDNKDLVRNNFYIMMFLYLLFTSLIIIGEGILVYYKIISLSIFFVIGLMTATILSSISLSFFHCIQVCSECLVEEPFCKDCNKNILVDDDDHGYPDSYTERLLCTKEGHYCEDCLEKKK